MMKKAILVILCLLLTTSAYAGTVNRHTTYATNSEVNSTNLNGNFDNIVTVVNGGLDNDNADTSGGYRFFEVLGALPAAGTEGRVIFLTTNDTINFDTGSAFQQTITVSGSPTQGDVIYYDGSAWSRLGSGTIGQVLTAQGATSDPAWQEASSTVVQVVNTQDGEVQSNANSQIPNDDTIPQNTEGHENITLAITPTDASNMLKIDVVWNGSSGANNGIAVALFQDTTADALACARRSDNTNAVTMDISFSHYMVAGTTSSTTFKVRSGSASTDTITFNGAAGGRLYGGVLASSITITEVIP